MINFPFLFLGPPCHHDSDDASSPCSWRRIGRTQVSKDFDRRYFCLFLVFLCLHFRPGSLWSHFTWILRLVSFPYFFNFHPKSCYYRAGGRIENTEVPVVISWAKSAPSGLDTLESGINIPLRLLIF